MEPASPSDRLDSWKEIAVYLGRTEKTARRWERREGLPVHRHMHAERGSVYAFRGEVDAWRASRKGRLAGDESAQAAGLDRASRRWTLVGLAAVGLAAAAALAIGWPTSTLPSAPPVLAVLAFESAPDRSGADLGAAMASAIVDHLSGAADIRVRPFASSLRNTRPTDDSAMTGRRMNADIVATGRIAASGNRLSVRVALIDVAANAQVWGTTYDIADHQLGPAQERIAVALHDQTLRARGVTPRGDPRISSRLSNHPEAVRAYLRGTGFPRNPGLVQIRTSIDYLHEAVRLDPAFAAAYASLGTAQVALSFFADAPAAATIGAARQYAERALALDPANGRAHQALAAVLHYFEFDHDAAERQFLEALRVAPRSSGVNNWYAEFLAEMRRFGEAEAPNRDAGMADPGWLEVDMVRGNLQLFQGRSHAAETEYRRALAIDPNHGLSRFFLGEALLARGDATAAVAELKAAAGAMGSPPFARAALARALALGGDYGAAERLIEDFTRERAGGYFPAFAIAEAYVGLGRYDRAMDWLERAVDERLFGYYLPSVAPAWHALHGDARFSRLLQRLALPDVR